MLRRRPVRVWEVAVFLAAIWFIAAAAVAEEAAASGQATPPTKDPYYENYKAPDRHHRPGRSRLREPIDRRELIEAAIRGVIEQARSLFQLHQPEGTERFPRQRGERVRRHRHSDCHRGRPVEDPQPAATARPPIAPACWPAIGSWRSTARAPTG